MNDKMCLRMPRRTKYTATLELFTVMIFIVTSAAGYNCSSETKCSCTVGQRGGIKAVCTGLGLRAIPKFDTNVTEIDLSHNMLDYLQRIFHNGVFKGLDNVVSLNLKGNNQNGIGYPEEIASLTTLRELEIDGIHTAVFPKEYSQLTVLSNLDLSSKGFSRINIVRHNMFSYLPNIESLTMASCSIYKIENGSFRGLSKLKHLDISDNTYLTFRVLANISYDLQFTSIRSLNLNAIHCSYGIGTIIFVDDIKCLYNTSLENLSLKFNRLMVLEENVEKHLPRSLKYIDISYNAIVTFKEVFKLLQLPNIKTLEMKKQPFFTMKKLSFMGICSHDWRGPSVKTKNVMQTLDVKVQNKSEVTNVTWDVSPSLQKISMSHVYLQFPLIFSLKIPSSNNINNVDLSYMVISKWIVPLKRLHKLQYLNMAHLSCSQISDEFFSDLPALKSLFINDNSIGQDISRGNLFTKLTNLTHLDISSVGLDKVPNNTFNGLSNLNILNVRSNSVSNWHAGVDHMVSLKFLDLSSNKIEHFDAKTRNSIDRIFKTSNESLTINLLDNALQCNCDTLAFLKWISHNKQHFKNFDEYSCVYGTTKRTFQNITVVITELQQRCSDYNSMILGIVIVIFSLIFIIFGAIIYRYRWRLRYIYQMVRRGYKPLSMEDGRQFEFDAFISYANEDGEFVERELLNKMEDTYGLKLRLHRRDFIAGKEIAANITDNIHKSRKTVAILSTKYLKSYWCMFEFNMARMESIYSRGGEPTLFIALLENLRTNDIPFMMMDLIDSDSYIEIPNTKHSEFWDNFHKAITL